MYGENTLGKIHRVSRAFLPGIGGGLPVFGGSATPEEKNKFYQLQATRTEQILNMPEEEFCKVEEVDFKFPGKARIFNSVRCGRCGEYVMEARARVRDGGFVCIPCADDYSRGW